MPRDNSDIATIFDEIADLLEIENANPFRVRAYRNAARQINSTGVPVASMIAKGEDLTQLPGIGDDLAAKIKEIVETGACRALEQLRKQTPPAVAQLLKVPGLGPKRVHALYHALDIETVKQLTRAAREGRIRALPRFGPKIEQKILDALRARASRPGRFTLAEAARDAEPLTAYLRKVPGVKRVVIAGSYRRRKETVGDLDILVTATDAGKAMDRFVAYREVRNVLAQGATRSTVVLKSGLQVDLRVVEESCFGSALQYFTGSKAHNIALRRLARRRGLKINEYGVFRRGKRIASDTEESVYRAVGLPWMAPWQRENLDGLRAKRVPVIAGRRGRR